ncbi:MAG: GatB/YqeY domain-containing protein [Oceanococcus sp.]|nr:MAG: GatB/YqeY domain-containing protein [Oceanococcus sp.]
MSLRARIQDDIKTAMRAREQDKLATLRMLSAAIKQREVDERVELADGDVLSLVEKLIKQRRDAAKQYDDGGRPELAEKEVAEAALLEVYLPAQLSDDELAALVDSCITEAGAAGPQDMGKVMGLIKPRAAGQADMGKVSQLVKARLTS